MSDSEHLLELIEERVLEHGGDLGGWTRRVDDRLHLFDGRVALCAVLRDAGPSSAGRGVHAHVLTTLHEHDDEVLDACLFGIAEDHQAALGQAAVVWITGVAGSRGSISQGMSRQLAQGASSAQVSTPKALVTFSVEKVDTSFMPLSARSGHEV